MSGAERQARFRAKQKAEIERLRNAAAVPPSDSDSPELIEARAEIERLRNATVTPPPSDSPELKAARAEIERLRNLNAVLQTLYSAKTTTAAARKAKAAAADEAAAKQYADDDRAALLERLLQADKQLKANRTRIRNLDEAIRRYQDISRHPPRMTKSYTGKFVASCILIAPTTTKSSDGSWRNAFRNSAESSSRSRPVTNLHSVTGRRVEPPAMSQTKTINQLEAEDFTHIECECRSPASPHIKKTG